MKSPGDLLIILYREYHFELGCTELVLVCTELKLGCMGLGGLGPGSLGPPPPGRAAAHKSERFKYAFF